MSAKVLIVEDDPSTRSALKTFLDRAGYETVAAGSFQEGRQIMAGLSPDLVITDIRLGEFNGLQLLALAKQRTAAIVITGFDDPVLRAEAQAFGADFLVKPVSPGDLLALVQQKLEVIAGRRMANPVRRWTRKAVHSTVRGHVDDLPVRLLDVSYGGLRFEIHRPSQTTLPQSFQVSLPDVPVAVPVELVWTSRTGEENWLCGAAVARSDVAITQAWSGFVDRLE
jgi:CheY-like chemotaxis protein